MVKTASLPRAGVDAADIEHIGAMVTGGILFGAGLRRRGLAGVLLNLAGAALFYRGQQGYRPLYDALGLELRPRLTGIGKHNAWAAAELTVERTPKELYMIWRNLENLPIIMDHLISVREIDDITSQWVARGPLGTIIRWDARIINDIPYELIAWETLEGSGVDHAGSVHFRDVGSGHTRVTVKLRYDPPADSLGIWLGAKTHVDPQRQIAQALYRFKEIMEVGNARAVVHTH